MDRMIDIAICQMQTSRDKEVNLRKAVQLIKTAAPKARLLVLPEIFNAPYQTDLLPAYAEPVPGPTTKMLSDLAREHRVVLVGGSIPEIAADGNIYNTSCVFAADGSMLGCHRKLHLFDIHIPDQIVFRESDVFTPGEDLPTFICEGMSFTVMICYDIRFPELARQAALNGSSLIIVPAAFNLTTGPAHWEILMRTRALDNQVFLAAASPARNPAASYQAWGHSLIVDPWGTILAEAGTGEEIIYARIDPAKLAKVRAELPLLQHRRPELYRNISRKEC
ncbi:MAG TPA: carbon-nitrogen hydrolase family protein [Syntrophomonas sp.]|nr:carbon-nitrogen hydrolase family protein [Syntrophomonas sp.]HRW11578.1 carbon-nitrogen hydrolase family protein [Syntrophomonas sp.]